MRQPNLAQEPRDFSVIPGGPVFQLLLRLHLTGGDLELLHRRLVLIAPIAWMPLLLLSLLTSPAGRSELFSFLHDVEVHARFLVALPVLLSAEPIVHRRMRPIVRRFMERRIVLPQDLPRFYR